MAQQTAVDWFAEQLPLIQQEGLRDIIEQAKQMFEKQIKDGWDNAAINASYSHNPKSFEQYYNETFGK